MCSIVNITNNTPMKISLSLNCSNIMYSTYILSSITFKIASRIRISKTHGTFNISIFEVALLLKFQL